MALMQQQVTGHTYSRLQVIQQVTGHPASVEQEVEQELEQEEEEEAAEAEEGQEGQEEGQEDQEEDEQEEDGDTLPTVEREGLEGALPCGRWSRRSHCDGVAGYAFDSRGRIVAVGSDSQLPSQHLPGKTPHNTLH